jgi:amino acid transporter
LEKEALLVLNEIMAKMNQNEKLIGLGAVVAVVGWIVGLILTSSWYSASGAQTIGLLAVLGAIAAIVVLYLKYAPNSNVAWPLPLTMIFLILGVVVAVVGLIGLFQAFTFDPCGGLCSLISNYVNTSKPITLYLATIAVLVGGGLMSYASYMEWVAAGKPTKV